MFTTDTTIHSPTRAPVSRRLPFVSVIVPVRNEARFIEHTLSQILGQDYPRDRFEVIVADGLSEDGTPELVQRLQTFHPNLHLVENPGIWSSAGRNAALAASRGDIIVLIDGHCDVTNPAYLSEVVAAFERSGANCVGRPQPLDVSRASPLQQAIALARASQLGHHPDSHIYSHCEGFVPPQSVAIAYRREVFIQVGTFDESFDACEDVEFNTRIDRAGLKCFFTPRVALHYHPRATLRGLFCQMQRYGRGRVRLLRKHPSTFTLAGFIPAIFVLGLLVGPLFSLLSPLMVLLYLGCVSLYAGLVLLTSLGLCLKSGNVRLLPWLPLIFMTVHLGAGWGQLLETVLPGRPPQRNTILRSQPQKAA